MITYYIINWQKKKVLLASLNLKYIEAEFEKIKAPDRYHCRILQTLIK